MNIRQLSGFLLPIHCKAMFLSLIFIAVSSYSSAQVCDVTDITVSPSEVCLEDSNNTAVFTLTGTPNATVDYTIANGIELDNNPITIGATGTVTIEVEPTTSGDITIFINNVSLGTCSNGSPTENFEGFFAESEADLDITSITVDNDEVCLDGNSIATFSIVGPPNGNVSFTITNGSSSVGSPLNLGLTGDGSIPVSPDSEGTVTLEITSVAGVACVREDLSISEGSFIANPLPDVSITGTDPTTCGEDGEITISGLVSGNDYSISYSPDDGNPGSGETFTSNGSSQVISIPAGTYEFTEIQNITTGCISPLDDIITLEDPAGSQANINDTSSTQGPVCLGDNITFVINTTAPSATVEYQIDNGSSQFVTTMGNTASVLVNNAQSDVTIDLISVSLNGCETNLSVSRTVEVSPVSSSFLRPAVTANSFSACASCNWSIRPS